jgi:hypothetical protein
LIVNLQLFGVGTEPLSILLFKASVITLFWTGFSDTNDNASSTSTHVGASNWIVASVLEVKSIIHLVALHCFTVYLAVPDI